MSIVASFPSAASAAARDWKAKLPRELRKASDLHGLALFGVSAAAYWLFFVGMFLAPFLWMRAACTVLEVLAIGALFVAGHDAGHRTLVRTSWLNRVLGRLAMLPAWHPFTSWIYVHNTLHHGWTNFKGRHPDYCPLTKDEYDALPAWRRAVVRFYRSPLGIGAEYVLEFYFNYFLWPDRQRSSPRVAAAGADRLLVLAFFVLQLTLGATLARLNGWSEAASWGWALVSIGVAWLAWAYFMGLASYQQHTHPRIAWYDKEDEWNFYHVQLKSSTHVAMPAFVDRLLHNIMDHPAHHLDPAIPMYGLPAGEKLLEERVGEHAVVVPWTFAEFLRTCRTCKLYDFKRHCWLDFDGQPTTECGLHGLPVKTQPRSSSTLAAWKDTHESGRRSPIEVDIAQRMDAR
jgi:omega-6 fatty acid desaturase (delta-12 desaturase)